MDIKEKAQKAHEKAVKKVKDKKNDYVPKDKEVFVSFLETPDYILEQIGPATRATSATLPPANDSNNKFNYIKYSKLEDKTEKIDHFDYQGTTFKPIISNLIEKNSVKLPSGVEEYNSVAEIIKDIKDYLYSYFDPPKFYEDFLPFYVLFTWVYDQFPFIAYLHFVGLTGTGKTIAAETITNVCYKPVDAAGSVTISSIFRLADQWKGTLFLDEFDLSAFGKDGYKAILTFLKTGVSDRAVLRVEGEKRREIESFIVKAPKIFTSETPITDAGLQSRTFVIKMEKSRRRLPLYKLNNYYDKAVIIRNKLLLWRFRNLNKIDLASMEYGIPELMKLDRRVQQIITPIYYLSDDEARVHLLEFAKQQEEETFRQRRESLEGQIFQFIYENISKTITISMIFEELNKGKKGKEISEKRIGNLVRKTIGFDIQRMGHNNISTLILNQEKVNELVEYYGIVSTGGSVAQVASVAQQSLIEEADDQPPF